MSLSDWSINLNFLGIDFDDDFRPTYELEADSDELELDLTQD